MTSLPKLFEFRRAFLAVVVTGFAAVGAAGNASATVADVSGTTVFGDVFGDFRIGCTTCSHIPLPMSGTPSQTQGGPGFASASISYFGTPQTNSALADYTVGGSAAYAASAAFSGIFATPTLRARSSAENVSAYLIVDPVVPVGIDTFNATATAQAIQRYTYTGIVDATYTFNFHVDAKLTTAQASFSANASLHNTDDPFLETSLASNGVFHLGTGLSGTSIVSDSFSVTATFEAGKSYYLKASLSVGSADDYASTSVSADAFNTLLVTSITGADPSLLVAGIAPVPEPQAYAMLALGLIVIGVARRRLEATADRRAVALA